MKSLNSMPDMYGHTNMYVHIHVHMYLALTHTDTPRRTRAYINGINNGYTAAGGYFRAIVWRQITG